MLRVFILVQFVISQLCLGSKNFTTVDQTKYALEVIRSSKTVGGLIEKIKPFHTVEEILGLKEIVKDEGLTLNTLLPKLKLAADNVITYGPVKISRLGKNRFKINQRVFSQKEGEPLDVFIKRVIRSVKTAAVREFQLFPSAHADPASGIAAVVSALAITAVIAVLAAAGLAVEKVYVMIVGSSIYCDKKGRFNIRMKGDYIGTVSKVIDEKITNAAIGKTKCDGKVTRSEADQIRAEIKRETDKIYRKDENKDGAT